MGSDPGQKNGQGLTPLNMSTRLNSILHSQLKSAALIWEQIQDHPYPADRWLGNYFHRHRKEIGARDRRFHSETIYSLFRHKSYLQMWVSEVRSRLGLSSAQCRRTVSDNFLMVLLGAVTEGVISES